jgi:hypothetical protein
VNKALVKLTGSVQGQEIKNERIKDCYKELEKLYGEEIEDMVSISGTLDSLFKMKGNVNSLKESLGQFVNLD